MTYHYTFANAKLEVIYPQHKTKDQKIKTCYPVEIFQRQTIPASAHAQGPMVGSVAMLHCEQHGLGPMTAAPCCEPQNLPDL